MITARPRFLAVTGTTASGKTDLSLALAERLSVEIISMDSRQVYTAMDIGTDKVGWEARATVPHHGLDIVRPDQRYSAGHFARDVRRWLDEIEGRDALPLLVGGTGFFLRAVTEPIFAEPNLDEARLAALRGYLAVQSVDELSRFVSVLDPARAALAIEGGPQRMSRTIEIALLSGVRLSTWHQEAPAEAAGISGLVLVLEVPREELDRRIDNRVKRMVERGLVSEVEGLLAAGYTDRDPGMSGTGYREISRHLRGEATLEEAIEDIRRSTRRYSRRQITWFRNQLPDTAKRIDATRPITEQLEEALKVLAAAGISPSTEPNRPH